MVRRSQRSVLALAAAVVAVGALTSCGGGDSPAGPNPGPSANPTPAATPTPRPAPTPTPDPRIGLAPGPVIRYTIKVRTVDSGARDAFQDEQGRWVVYPGERVDFDSTQKNAGNEICTWVNDPTWRINGRDLAFESSNGIVFRRGSSQPFLLKVTVESAGEFTVHAVIDGVESNVLTMRSRNR